MSSRSLASTFLLAAALSLLFAAACASEERSADPTPADTPAPPPTATPVQEDSPTVAPPAPTRTPWTPPLEGRSGLGETIIAETKPIPTPVRLEYEFPDVAGVVEWVRPAVVSVVTEFTALTFFGPQRDVQSGSGVIIDPRGYLLTNYHVIQDYDRITVTTDDGVQYDAEVIGTDLLSDLAVLKIDRQEYSFVTAALPESVWVGDWVIAIGNALALPGGPSVTVGVVSALDRSYEIHPGLTLYGLIQTDASINPGNSGGPLLNLQGQLVGINTAVARGDDAGRTIEGIGFAVATDTAMSVAWQLIELGKVRWAFLGVGVDDLTPSMATSLGIPVRGGVMVATVTPDSPAWEAGLRGGDVIVAFGGENVSTARQLIGMIRESQVGRKVEVEAFSNEERVTFTVTLGERPDS